MPSFHREDECRGGGHERDGKRGGEREERREGEGERRGRGVRDTISRNDAGRNEGMNRRS